MRPPAGMRRIFMVLSSWCCCLLTMRTALLVRVAAVTVAQSSDQLKRPGSARWVDCERRI